MPRARAHSPSADRPAIVIAALAALFAPPLLADWPLIWDFDGRPDEPVAARVGPSGDLWILAESHTQGSGVARAVLLRVGADGELAWATDDTEQTRPRALAVREDGAALAVGRSDSLFRATAFGPDGAIAWSRTRSDVVANFPFAGPEPAPIWDSATSSWRVPVEIGGDFAILAWDAAGKPLPDLLWSPPAGTGRATSILPRPGGGWIVAGTVDDVPPPGWWTIAFDAAGVELWSRFEHGVAPAGAFGEAILLSADPIRLWAVDETACGVFSLLVWAYDRNGSPLWQSTWPPPGDCDSFEADAVVLAGGRIVAGGVGSVSEVGASFDPIALALDAANGALVWATSFVGATTGIRGEVVSAGGEALLASTLFPSPNPGPTPLWLAAWTRDGQSCGAAVEALPARVPAAALRPSIGAPGNDWILVGYGVAGATAGDLIVQRVAAPCSPLFADGFESAGTTAWSSVVP